MIDVCIDLNCRSTEHPSRRIGRKLNRSSFLTLLINCIRSTYKKTAFRLTKHHKDQRLIKNMCRIFKYGRVVSSHGVSVVVWVFRSIQML